MTCLYPTDLGGLEPLVGCVVLRELDLSDNRFSGGREPLQNCTALLWNLVDLSHNQFTGGHRPLQRFKALLRRVGALARL